MYELKVSVKKVMGECTANPPMKPGDYFTVSDGDIRVPEGGYICLWALQSLMPLLTPKEREITEEEDEDWMWRVHHAQCPDPNGRVIFQVERTGRVRKRSGKPRATRAEAPPGPDAENGSPGEGEGGETHEEGLRILDIHVESVNGKCTSRMKPGDHFVLRSGRLYVPPDCHACLYAVQAAIPLLPAKQRVMEDGDWLRDEFRVLCPDPAGNVILRIDTRDGDGNDPL